MDYIIRQAKDEDKNEILHLLNLVFSGSPKNLFLRGDDFWFWKYKKNPFGESILTIAESNGRIIGVDNLWPWELRAYGSVKKAFQPCDTAVDPLFRNIGVFKSMRLHGLKIAEKRNITFFYNFPNNNSLSVNLSLEWEYLGKVPWMVKILKPVEVIRSLISKELSEPLKPYDDSNVDFEMLDEMAGKYSQDNLIEINRIKGFHAWRYSKPGRLYEMIKYNENGAIAIAVFTLNVVGCDKEMIIVDILGDINVFPGLINNVIDKAKEKDVIFVSIMKNPLIKTIDMLKMGFIPKKLKNMAVRYRDLNAVNKYKYWNLIAAMHDSL